MRIYLEMGRVRRQYLRDAGLIYEPVTISNGNNGIAIDEAALEVALAALSREGTAREVSRRDETLSIGEHVIALNIVYSRTPAPVDLPVTPAEGATPAIPTPAREFKVSSGSIDISPDKVYKLVKEIFIPVIQKDVEIKLEGSYREPNNNADFFKIFLYAAPPSGNKMGTCLDKMFGIKVVTSSGTYTTSCSGFPITDDETGREVGEVFDNSLFIFHRIFENSSEDSLKLFKIFLEKAAVILKLSSEERNNYNREEMSVKNYIRILKSKHDVVLNHSKENIKNLTEKVTKKRSELLEDVRRLNAELVLKEKLSQRDPDEDNMFMRQYKEFKNIHGVKEVMVRDSILVVDTENLYCVDPRSKILHNIGEFRIELDTSIGQIRWKNKTYKDGFNNMQAPHVFADGRACMGNSEEIFTDLIAKFELPAAIMMAINFIEEVNVDDGAGRHINTWPKADKAKYDLEREAERKRREALTDPVEPTGVPVT